MFPVKGKYHFTSESVTEGHPDKIADQISDAVLDALFEEDLESHVACETLLTTGLAVIAGEITTAGYADLPTIVRETIKKIGYDSSDMGFDWQTCAVIAAIGKQSQDINQGVSRKKPEDQGAGDQGMMFGFACTETPTLMPAPIYWAHQLSLALTRARQDKVIPYLRPDGKTQLSFVYENGKPCHIDNVVVSSQHAPDIPQEQIIEDITQKVIIPTLPQNLFNPQDAKIFINATGRFVVGGPMGDAGLTGRKIIQDTYGGMGHHGGGAFSGKDPSKVDRSGAYMARYIAKNVVASGLASQCEVQIAYCIGVAEPVSVLCSSLGTGKVNDETLTKAVKDVFDMRPYFIVRDLDLKRPIYQKTSCYGHFGRELPEFTWEKTDKINDLLAATKA
ncbi:MAG: methionine adenosyltransferase [Deltaproteobacteria bacterium]|jgi:S-adenosylmethionine synthetase|nr:methionine adenosyltransferase [Deltaproteobacteria bacterium]